MAEFGKDDDEWIGTQVVNACKLSWNSKLCQLEERQDWEWYESKFYNHSRL